MFSGKMALDLRLPQVDLWRLNTWCGGSRVACPVLSRHRRDQPAQSVHTEDKPTSSYTKRRILGAKRLNSQNARHLFVATSNWRAEFRIAECLNEARAYRKKLPMISIA
jgi:hypothetical protein